MLHLYVRIPLYAERPRRTTVLRHARGLPRRYRAPDGNPIADFVSVKSRDELAELCAERAKKGDKIAVFGDFETVAVKDSPERQPGFLIKASAVEFLTPRKTIGEAVAAMFGGIAGEDAA